MVICHRGSPGTDLRPAQDDPCPKPYVRIGFSFPTTLNGQTVYINPWTDGFWQALCKWMEYLVPFGPDAVQTILYFVYTYFR